jgi:hypothetical protein
MNDKTIQYVVGMGGMVVLGVAAMVMNSGNTSEVIAVAVAGGIGFHLGAHGKAEGTETSKAQIDVSLPGGK